MENKQLKFTNRSQFEALVMAMEQNVEVARGHGKSGLGRVDPKPFWNKLAEKLNSLGPPTRDGPAWLKVWNDQKYYALKKKLVHNNKQLKGTGGGPSTEIALNYLEKSIQAILQLQVVVNSVGTSFGIKSTVVRPIREVSVENTNGEITNDENKENEPTTSLDPNHHVDTVTPTPKRRLRPNTSADLEEKSMRLLDSQTSTQLSILKEHKETNRYLRKLTKLKEEENMNLQKLTKLKEEEVKLRIEEIQDKKKFRLKVLEIKVQKLQRMIKNIDEELSD